MQEQRILILLNKRDMISKRLTKEASNPHFANVYLEALIIR